MDYSSPHVLLSIIQRDAPTASYEKRSWQEYICQDRKSTRFGFTKKAMSDCSIKTVNSTTTKNNYGEAFADLPAMQRAVAHANFSSKLSQS